MEMPFSPQLVTGKLVKRYKRFLADIILDSGEMITAHCPNSGSMMGLTPEGAPVALTFVDNPKRKYQFSWEMVQIDGVWVGINTHRANKIVAHCLENKIIEGLPDDAQWKAEVKYGENSRIDFFIESESGKTIYLEVKNVTLSREGYAEFPDAKTTRGTKHLRELTQMMKEGHRAILLYLVQRNDCQKFRIAGDIDPDYFVAFKEACKHGLEVYPLICTLTPESVTIQGKLG